MIEAVEEHPGRHWTDNPPTVTAVVVSRNGARWLPQCLGALAAQAHPPTAVIGVDVASEDTSADLLRQHTQDVRTVPAGTGFGDAVRTALDGTRPTDWLWLLHDDCAAEPEALAYLLDAATAAADVALVGPKIREWPSLRRLLEVGVSLTGTGRRETGLERGEPDQGQHDRARDVLAVSTAGMLVRRDAWDELGGLDPALPLFCDDLDLGWRLARRGLRARVAPQAVLFHLEASDQGLRTGSLAPVVRRERRRAAIYTLLVNASRPGLVWQWFRLLLGSLLRVAALLLAKAPADARDELLGTLAAYRRPIGLLRARRSRARTATRPPGEVRHLLPPTSLPYRHGLDSVAELARVLVRPEPAVAGRRAAVEPGPAAPEAEDLPSERNVLLRRPWLGCVLVLVVLSVVAGRGLFGGGNLLGGALLPAPDSAGVWWRLFFESWHEVGVGSALPAPPYVLALAVPATLVWSNPGLVVDLVMLAGVPLAALTAHRLARSIFDTRSTRIWWSLTYAVLLVCSGAVAQGRIGTVVALVLAPLVTGAAVALVRAPHWQHGARLALWLGVATAFAPVAYVLAAVPLVIVAAVRLRGARLWPVVLGLALPWPMLGSWMWTRAVDPNAWWWEAGRADAGVGTLDPAVWQLALGRAGGPGNAPAWIGAGLLLGGALALLRTDRRGRVLATWLVGLVGLALAVLGAGTYLTPDTAGDPVPVWVGLPIACWLAAMATAAGLAADGAREYLAGRRFGLLQPLAAVVGVAAILAPLLGGAWWVARTSRDPLERSAPSTLPAYLVARAATGSGTLVIRGTTRRGVDFDLYRGDGDRLGDEAVRPDDARSEPVGDAVTGLLTNPSDAQLETLASYDLGALYLSPPADEHLVEVLDSAPGLSPSGSPYPKSRVWTFDAAAEPTDRDPADARRWVATLQTVFVAGVIIAAAPGRRRRDR